MFEKRCVLCSTTNKKNGKLICEECSFIKDFMIKYGRENMRIIVANFNNMNAIHNNSVYNMPLANLMHDMTHPPFVEPSAPPYIICRICKKHACSCKQS